MPYQYLSELGSGGFGTVYKALDLCTSRLVAVKVLVQDDGFWEHSRAVAFRGEGQILPSLDHPHIIRLLGCEGWLTPRIEISMELMDGTLYSLVHSLPNYAPAGLVTRITESMLYQMLQALDYLDSLGYVHRDVKPENILYTSQGARPAQHQQLTFPSSSSSASPATANPITNTSSSISVHTYNFKLGDFGLCDRADNLPDYPHGSQMYFAPELFSPSFRQQQHDKQHPQTPPPRVRQSHKSDVWALHIAALWALDIPRGFRTCRGGNAADIAEDLRAFLVQGGLSLVRWPGVAEGGGAVVRGALREMGRVEVGQRRRAGEVLGMCFS